MAKFVRRNFNVVCFCFVQSLFSIVLSSHIGDNLSPSIVTFHQIDGNTLQYEDLFRTVYHHVQKRSPVTPIKKASATVEKKLSPKDISVHLEKFKSEAANATGENSTVMFNSSDSSNIVTNSPNELYNISATNASGIVSNSSQSTTTTTTPTTTSTTMTTTTTTAAAAASSDPNATSSEPSSEITPTEFWPTKPSNISNATFDHHIYYNSEYLEGEKAMAYWVDFDTMPQGSVIVHGMLSHSHRRAATVNLSFEFPFYGHLLRNITIATGGFVYMGDYMHSWLAATQYIAPLMANFDTSLSNESTVRYIDNGTAFVIEWHEVALQDKTKGGNFTFQTILLKNGNIIFVYEVIPVSVTEIGDDAHPVKVGLSDAYVIDKIMFFIRRKTIYEYHRIDKKKEEIANHTAIYFTALPICLSIHDCASCMNADVGLNCMWCDSLKRCSDGLDRHRQEWLQAKCDVERSSINCSALPLPDVNPYVQPLTDSPSKSYTLFPRPAKPEYSHETSTVPYMSDKGRHNSDNGASTSARVAEDSSSLGVGSVVAILLLLAIVMGGLGWVGYAYRNPHTSSGQLLIRYRPSQWRFRSGEARYTAASVHM